MKKRKAEKAFYKAHALPDFNSNVDYDAPNSSSEAEAEAEAALGGEAGAHTEGKSRVTGRAKEEPDDIIQKYLHDSDEEKFDDVDYYRRYKRTTRNVWECLQGLLNSTRQGTQPRRLR